MRITSEPFKGSTFTVTSRGAKSATVRMKLNRHWRCACRWWANATQSGRKRLMQGRELVQYARPPSKDPESVPPHLGLARRCPAIPE